MNSGDGMIPPVLALTEAEKAAHCVCFVGKLFKQGHRFKTWKERLALRTPLPAPHIAYYYLKMVHCGDFPTADTMLMLIVIAVHCLYSVRLVFARNQPKTRFSILEVLIKELRVNLFKLQGLIQIIALVDNIEHLYLRGLPISWTAGHPPDPIELAPLTLPRTAGKKISSPSILCAIQPYHRIFEMDAVGSALLKQMYAFTLNLLRRYTIDHIQEGDVALDQLRTQISTEFEKLKAGIESLRLAKLKTAQQNLADAMIYLENGLVDQAREHFGHAQQNAIEGFTTAVNFDGKVLATKIRLLSLFHLEGYFTSSTPNTTALEALCRQALMPLFESAEVQSAIAYRDGGLFGFGKKEGRRVLEEISAVRHTVSVQLSPVTRFQLLNSSGQALDLHDVIVKEISCDGTRMTVAGGKIFAGTVDGRIRAWDMTTYAELPALQGHTNDVLCLLASEDRLYSGSNDNTIRVWDLHTHKELGCLSGHTERVYCIAVSGSKLYSGGRERTIRMWDLLTFSELICVECTDLVNRLAISSNKLYGGCFSKFVVRVWDLDTLQASDVKLEGHTHEIRCMTILGNRLFTGSWDNTIRVWDLINHTEIACLRGHTNWVLCLAISGNRLYSGGEDKTVRVLDLDTLAEVVCIDCYAIHLQISAGKIYAVGSGKITVRLL